MCVCKDRNEGGRFIEPLRFETCAALLELGKDSFVVFSLAVQRLWHVNDNDLARGGTVVERVN